MTKNEGKPREGGAIWNFLASVKLTVVVLIALAATSVLGTLIPQNNPLEWYFHRYGEAVFRLVDLFRLFDMYHSWWFQFLIIALVVNIVVCSLDRFPATWKIVATDQPTFRPERFRKQRSREVFTVESSVNAIAEIYAASMARRFRYHRTESTDRGAVIFAETGRWSRLGVYGVHASVVLLLIGALVGSIFGFDGFVNIVEGETVGEIRLRQSDLSQPLEFKIRCDDFDVSFYDNGAPKEYRSRLSIINDEKVVYQKDIIVNDPLRYRGVNVFQSSYGQLPPNTVTLRFTDMKSGQTMDVPAVVGGVADMPDGSGTFAVTEHRDTHRFKGHQFQNAFLGTWTGNDGRVVDVVMPFPFPDFDRNNAEERQRIRTFQSTARLSAGELPDEITLSFTSNETGMVYNRTVVPGKAVEIPEGLGTFRVLELTPSYQFRGQPIGEALVGSLQKPSGEKETVVLPIRFTKFDRMRQGEVVIAVVDFDRKGTESGLPMIVAVSDYEEKYYTGLQVTKDPGVWIVYAGFILMIIGCYVTFFVSHRQVFIELSQAGGKTTVMVAGRSNKNKLGMRQQTEKVAERLKRLA